MLDDGDRGRALGIEFGDQFEGGVGVADVVVREFLALQLARPRDAIPALRRQIESRFLMRVLAVAQRLR